MLFVKSNPSVKNYTVFCGNSSTTVTDDTTSFAYISGGALLPTGSPAADFKKRIRLPFEMRDGDVYSLFVIPPNDTFHPASEQLPQITSGTNTYGMWWQKVSGSATDIDVWFGHDGATPDTTWTTLNTAGWKWVFRATTLWGGSDVYPTRNGMTVTQAEAQNYVAGDMVWCSETSTLYQYDAGSSATRDGTFVLNVLSGTGRLLAIAGQYARSEIIRGFAGNGIKFQENGGTQVGSVSDTGAWTFGPSNGLAATDFYRFYLSNNDGQALPTTGSVQGLAIGWNKSSGQGEVDLISTRTSASLGGFAFYSMASDSPSGNKLGEVTYAGKWTLGPSAITSDIQHVIQSGATGSNYVLKVVNTRTDGGGNGLLIDTTSVSGTNNYPLAVRSNSVDVGFVNEDGTWSFGSQSPGDVSIRHVFYGNELRIDNRDNTAPAGTWIKLNTGTANRWETGFDSVNYGTNGFYWYTYTGANGYVGGISTAGAWTLGSATATTANHEFLAASTGAVLKVTGSGTGGAYIRVVEEGTQEWYMGMDNGSSIFKVRPTSLATASAAECTVAGAWTLGPASYAGSHSVNGTLTCTYTVNSRVDVLLSNTNTGSSAAACYLLQANGGYAYIVKVGTANAGYGGADSLSLVNETGGSYLTAGGTTWNAISDMRFKTKVADFHPVIDKLSTLSVFTYQLNESLDAGKAPVELGLSAQEMLLVAPEIVSGSEETKYGICYDRLSVVLVKAIQEQQTIIEGLKSRIEVLEAAS